MPGEEARRALFDHRRSPGCARSGRPGAEATAVTIDYKTLAATRDQVAPGTQPYVKCALHFDPDPTDGQKIAVDIWRMNFNPSGPVGFIADDYGNWQLKGMILDDTANHPLSPYGL